MVESNPAEQYHHMISDIIQRFVNSMRDSRARVDINSSREDGFCIVELTLWRCRTCPDHLYLFRTLFYMRKQYNITILQRHLDAIVWTYSVHLFVNFTHDMHVWTVLAIVSHDRLG